LLPLAEKFYAPVSHWQGHQPQVPHLEAEQEQQSQQEEEKQEFQDSEKQKPEGIGKEQGGQEQKEHGKSCFIPRFRLEPPS
jgi:hypothetical protein